MVFYELLQSMWIGFPDNLDEFSRFYPEEVRPYLRKLSEISKQYLEVESFLDRDVRLQPQKSSHFMSAFCLGIQEVLSEFDSVLCEIENFIVNDADFSPITIIVMLKPVTRLLPSIVEGIQEIKTRDIKGCLLIDLCHKFHNCGPPEVKKAYHHILKHCTQAFILHTKYWIINGQLLDSGSEYFIKQNQEETTNTSLASTTVRSDSFKSVYSIEVSRLPNFMAYSIASKFLFIGETLILCRKDTPEENVEKINSLLKSSSLDQTSLSKELDKIADLDLMTSFDFHNMDGIWSRVDKFVRRLVDEIGNLRMNLNNIKDIYLLGRGELFQEFLVNSDHIMDKKPSKMLLGNLKVKFNNSFYSVYGTDNSEFFESINIRFSNRFSSDKTVLDLLEVDMKLNWPLSLNLFTPTVMEGFNRLFKFLLKLKRAQLDILQVWAITKVSKESELYSKAMVLRNNLVSLVGNLQSYCYFNVIAKEFNVLIQSLESDSYFAVQTSLAKFQENLFQQLFLYHFDLETETFNESTLDPKFNKKVYNFFKILFGICRSYSSLAKNGELNESHEQIASLSNKLDQSIKSLVKMVSAADNTSNIRNLMICIDYNGFFTSNLNK